MGHPRQAKRESYFFCVGLTDRLQNMSIGGGEPIPCVSVIRATTYHMFESVANLKGTFVYMQLDSLLVFLIWLRELGAHSCTSELRLCW